MSKDSAGSVRFRGGKKKKKKRVKEGIPVAAVSNVGVDVCSAVVFEGRSITESESLRAAATGPDCWDRSKAQL